MESLPSFVFPCYEHCPFLSLYTLLYKESAQHCFGCVALIKYNKHQIMNKHNFKLLKETNWNIQANKE